MIPKILVIDDEEHMCWALERAMKQEGYQVLTTTRGRTGLDLIREEAPSLIILDMKMPEMDGMEVLKKAKELNPKLPVVMLTAHGTIETAIEAMKMGATDYLTKPFDLDELKMVIRQNLVMSQLVSEVNFLRSELTKKYWKMIGESPALKEVLYLIEKVSSSNATLLITGESGTGKEVAAVAIHKNSPRCDHPFVPVNCAALPENLLESELFGHEKGAFTGAVARKLGRFEMADRGTLFLDEITEMPLSMQVKLLRVLQEKSFERVGGNETLHVDVRIIAASNRDINSAIEKGLFREDLYYRLNVVHINLPPLRERKEDIPLLTSHFIEKLRPTYLVNSISNGAMKLLTKYHWPGNIRELQNVLERAAIISHSNEITVEDLPKEFQIGPAKPGGDMVVGLPEGGISLEDLEKELIIKALEKCKGNQTRAAQLLGITRSALLYRIQKHGLS